VTSAGAVARVKRLLPGGTKVGHTGTLDPLASGLLVLLLGRSTRLSRYATDLDKTYTATARFGAVSDTLDADGDITPLHDAPMPDEATLRAALPAFTGHLLQVPPMASALKRGGVRLYDLHRRGLTVEREPRPVTIHSLELVALDRARESATFEVSCTSGTYVRSLISDLADHLGTGAYLTALRRSRVGHLAVERAISPEDLSETTLYNHIIQSGEVMAHLPRVEVGEEDERSVRSGRPLPARGIGGSFRVEREGLLLAIYRDGDAEAKAEVVLCGA
jgi:tRNA pseudouridine55 synthase